MEMFFYEDILLFFYFINTNISTMFFAGEAPPPGAYDPKFDTKVKGLVIEKSDRFLDTKSMYSAECNVSVSGKSTGVISIPPFRSVRIITSFIADQEFLISQYKLLSINLHNINYQLLFIIICTMFIIL